MDLTLRNVPKRLDQATVRRAVGFFAERLMGSRLARNLTVRVVFVKGLKADGYCIWEDDNHKPREFSIHVNARYAMVRVLTILAHEMVHVKQYARGELKDYLTTPTACRFNGVYHDTALMSYDDHPWEDEAYSKEGPLVRAFKEQEK